MNQSNLGYDTIYRVYLSIKHVDSNFHWAEIWAQLGGDRWKTRCPHPGLGSAEKLTKLSEFGIRYPLVN